MNDFVHYFLDIHPATRSLHSAQGLRPTCGTCEIQIWVLGFKVNRPINATVSSAGHYDDYKFGNIFFTHTRLEYKVNPIGIIFFHTKLN